MAIASFSLWWLFDRSKNGLGLAVLVTVCACAVLQFLIYLGVYRLVVYLQYPGVVVHLKYMGKVVLKPQSVVQVFLQPNTVNFLYCGHPRDHKLVS